MRGLAALLVVPRHTDLFGTAAADSHSYLAVDLFFMLSGFVIAHAYERQLLSGAISAGRFIVIRLVRLYPIFLLGVLLATGVALTRGAVEPNYLSKWTPADPGVSAILTSAALALFYLPSKLGDSVLLFPLNTAFWSLMFELAVNIGYVMVFRFLSTRRLWYIVLASGLALGAFALRRNGLETGWAWGFMSIASGFLRATFGFAAGVLLFRLFSVQAPIRSNLGAIWTLALVSIPLLLPDTSATNGLVDDIAVLLVFPMAVLLGAHSSTQGWTTRLFALLGNASYPIYVLHVPLLILYERGLAAAGIEAERRLGNPAGWVFMLAVVLLALALDRWYDQPVRRTIVQRLKLRVPRPQELHEVAVPEPVDYAQAERLGRARNASPAPATMSGLSAATSPVDAPPGNAPPVSRSLASGSPASGSSASAPSASDGATSPPSAAVKPLRNSLP